MFHSFLYKCCLAIYSRVSLHYVLTLLFSGEKQFHHLGLFLEKSKYAKLQLGIIFKNYFKSSQTKNKRIYNALSHHAEEVEDKSRSNSVFFVPHRHLPAFAVNKGGKRYRKLLLFSSFAVF